MSRSSILISIGRFEKTSVVFHRIGYVILVCIIGYVVLLWGRKSSSSLASRVLVVGVLCLVRVL
jgi:hypothetical protein